MILIIGRNSLISLIIFGVIFIKFAQSNNRYYSEKKLVVPDNHWRETLCQNELKTATFSQNHPRRYHRCIEINGTMIVSSKVCPKGLYYDKNKQKCTSLPGNGQAMFIDYEATCPNNYEGILKHPTQFQYYYVCQRTSVIVSKCASLHMFDTNSHQCQPIPLTAQCTIRIYDATQGEIYVPDCTTNGRYPIPGNCRFYYICVSDGSVYYQYVHKCPGNTKYCPIKKVCSYQAACEELPSTTESWAFPEDSSPPCRKEGRYRSPKDCSLYYSCSVKTNGTFYQERFQCPFGTVFSESKKHCVEDLSECDLPLEGEVTKGFLSTVGFGFPTVITKHPVGSPSTTQKVSRTSSNPLITTKIPDKFNTSVKSTHLPGGEHTKHPSPNPLTRTPFSHKPPITPRPLHHHTTTMLGQSSPTGNWNTTKHPHKSTTYGNGTHVPGYSVPGGGYETHPVEHPPHKPPITFEPLHSTWENITHSGRWSTRHSTQKPLTTGNPLPESQHTKVHVEHPHHKHPMTTKHPHQYTTKGRQLPNHSLTSVEHSKHPVTHFTHNPPTTVKPKTNHSSDITKTTHKHSLHGNRTTLPRKSTAHPFGNFTHKPPITVQPLHSTHKNDSHWPGGSSTKHPVGHSSRKPLVTAPPSQHTKVPVGHPTHKTQMTTLYSNSSHITPITFKHPSHRPPHGHMTPQDGPSLGITKAPSKHSTLVNQTHLHGPNFTQSLPITVKPSHSLPKNTSHLPGSRSTKHPVTTQHTQEHTTKGYDHYLPDHSPLRTKHPVTHSTHSPSITVRPQHKHITPFPKNSTSKRSNTNHPVGNSSNISTLKHSPHNTKHGNTTPISTHPPGITKHPHKHPTHGNWTHLTGHSLPVGEVTIHPADHFTPNSPITVNPQHNSTQIGGSTHKTKVHIGHSTHKPPRKTKNPHEQFTHPHPITAKPPHQDITSLPGHSSPPHENSTPPNRLTKVPDGNSTHKPPVTSQHPGEHTKTPVGTKLPHSNVSHPAEHTTPGGGHTRTPTAEKTPHSTYDYVTHLPGHSSTGPLTTKKHPHLSGNITHIPGYTSTKLPLSHTTVKTGTKSPTTVGTTLQSDHPEHTPPGGGTTKDLGDHSTHKTMKPTTKHPHGHGNGTHVPEHTPPGRTTTMKPPQITTKHPHGHGNGTHLPEQTLPGGGTTKNPLNNTTLKTTKPSQITTKHSHGHGNSTNLPDHSLPGGGSTKHPLDNTTHKTTEPSLVTTKHPHEHGNGTHLPEHTTPGGGTIKHSVGNSTHKTTKSTPSSQITTKYSPGHGNGTHFPEHTPPGGGTTKHPVANTTHKTTKPSQVTTKHPNGLGNATHLPEHTPLGGGTTKHPVNNSTPKTGKPSEPSQLTTKHPHDHGNGTDLPEHTPSGGRTTEHSIEHSTQKTTKLPQATTKYPSGHENGTHLPEHTPPGGGTTKHPVNNSTHKTTKLPLVTTKYSPGYGNGTKLPEHTLPGGGTTKDPVNNSTHKPTKSTQVTTKHPPGHGNGTHLPEHTTPGGGTTKHPVDNSTHETIKSTQSSLVTTKHSPGHDNGTHVPEHTISGGGTTTHPVKNSTHKITKPTEPSQVTTKHPDGHGNSTHLPENTPPGRGTTEHPVDHSTNKTTKLPQVITKHPDGHGNGTNLPENTTPGGGTTNHLVHNSTDKTTKPSQVTTKHPQGLGNGTHLPEHTPPGEGTTKHPLDHSTDKTTKPAHTHEPEDTPTAVGATKHHGGEITKHQTDHTQVTTKSPHDHGTHSPEHSPPGEKVTLPEDGSSTHLQQHTTEASSTKPPGETTKLMTNLPIQTLPSATSHQSPKVTEGATSKRPFVGTSSTTKVTVITRSPDGNTKPTPSNKYHDPDTGTPVTLIPLNQDAEPILELEPGPQSSMIRIHFKLIRRFHHDKDPEAPSCEKSETFVYSKQCEVFYRCQAGDLKAFKLGVSNCTTGHIRNSDFKLCVITPYTRCSVPYTNYEGLLPRKFSELSTLIQVLPTHIDSDTHHTVRESPEPDFCYQEGVFPLPGNCSTYYSCVQFKDGTFHKHVFNCPVNHYFNASNDQCLPGKSNSCNDKPKCVASGNFPIVGDCREYYNCVRVDGSFKIEYHICPKGHIFGAIMKKCVPIGLDTCNYDMFVETPDDGTDVDDGTDDDDDSDEDEFEDEFKDFVIPTNIPNIMEIAPELFGTTPDSLKGEETEDPLIGEVAPGYNSRTTTVKPVVKNETDDPLLMEVAPGYNRHSTTPTGGTKGGLENDTDDPLLMDAAPGHHQVTTSTGTKEPSKTTPEYDTPHTTVHSCPGSHRVYEGKIITCPGAGAYRLPNSCHKYYECNYNPRCLHYVPTDILECPPCLRFNQITGHCDYPHNVPECAPRMPDRHNCSGPGLFIIKNDCTRYVECEKAVDGGFIGVRRKCPENHNFNPHTMKCEKECKCFIEKPVCSKEGFFVNKYGCEYYYQCVELGENKFELFEYECPGILLFDEEKQHCDIPENVKGCQIRNNYWESLLEGYRKSFMTTFVTPVAEKVEKTFEDILKLF